MGQPSSVPRMLRPRFPWLGHPLDARVEHRGPQVFAPWLEHGLVACDKRLPDEGEPDVPWKGGEDEPPNISGSAEESGDLVHHPRSGDK